MSKISAKKLFMKLESQKNISGYTADYRKGIGYCQDIIVAMINKHKKKTVNRLFKAHKITEVCNWCENAVTLYWDTKHDGYNIYCPCCGKEMELSDAYYREVTAKEQELK